MRSTSILVVVVAAVLAACVDQRDDIPRDLGAPSVAGMASGAGGALPGTPQGGTGGDVAAAGASPASGAAGAAGAGNAGGTGATNQPEEPPGPFDGTGDLRDGHLRFAGRWERSDAGVARSFWGGAYVRVVFEGAELKVDVDGGATFLLDGLAVTPATSTGTVHDLTPRLLAGRHELLVVAANQNLELQFRGLVLAAGTVTVAPPARPLLEFIGDSITTGAGADFSSLLAYSWLTGEQLLIDHTQISFSGAALTSGYGFTSDKTGMDVEFFRTKNFNHAAADNPAWDFGQYQAQLVVINLGTNDANEPSTTFQTSYESFLVAVRAKYPSAELVALRPFGGAFASEIEQAVQARLASGDPHTRFIDTEGWLQSPSDFVDGVHPTPEGHQKVAARLAPLLRPYLPSAE